MHDELSIEALSDKCFGDLLKLVHELTGITIGSNRKSMVHGRLRRHMMNLNFTKYEDYLTQVRSNKNEQMVFIDLLTTNETSFFRTPRIWDYIEKCFLPQWFSQNPKRTLRAWSAAASSGEEAHSLAMLCQNFKEKNSEFNYHITGTDISEKMVSLCNQGHFTGKSIEGLKSSRPDFYARYMKKVEGHIFQIAPDLKSRLQFNSHNLFNPLPTSAQFDLVLMRNVLIYFATLDQERVLKRIFSNLLPGAQLIIGESESLNYIKTDFKQIEPLIYHRPVQSAQKAS